MDYAIHDEQLQAIADAIRLQTDNPAPMSVDDMPLQIGLIDGGGGLRMQTGTITLDNASPTISIALDGSFVPSYVKVFRSEIILNANGVNGVLMSVIPVFKNASTTDAGNGYSHTVWEARTTYSGYSLAFTNQSTASLWEQMELSKDRVALPCRNSNYPFFAGTYYWFAVE